MAFKQEKIEARWPNARLFLEQLGPVGSVLRHRRMFVVIFLGIVLLSLVATFVIPARYVATGMVIVAEADPATQTSDVWAQKQGDPADLESQIMILRSARLMKLALAQPGALKAAEEICRNLDGGCAKLDASSAQLAEKAAERYSVSAVGRSRVLSISYTSASPENAMTMANALVTAYLDDQRGSESNSRATAAKWLWQEVSNLDREIREQVTKIDAFRRQNGLVQGATASISSENLTNTTQQLAAAEQSKALAQARLDAIHDIKNGANAANYQAVLDNRTVADLKQQIALLGNELAASSAVLGMHHPKRQMLEASAAALQQQLKNEISRISASAEKDYEAASNLVISLRQQVDRAKEDASNALANESSLEGMVRDVDAKRQLYTQLYQRASELETERRALSGGGRLVSLAEKPLKPNFPKKVPMVAAGLALGFFLAAASCVLVDKLGQGIKFAADTRQARQEIEDEIQPDSPEDTTRDGQAETLPDGKAEQQWHDDSPAEPLPIIGSLPNLPAIGSAGRGSDNLLSVLRRSMLSAGFKRSAKMLAAELFEACARRPILVLPADTPSRGAALLTLIIGQELAAKGLKVLAIECTPTSSDFATAFALPKQRPTLSDVLIGTVKLPVGVSHSASPGFDVIAGDDASLGLIESGGARGLQTLVDWAGTYDLVLLSGPALLDSRSRRALQAFGRIGLSALVCVDRDKRYEKRLAGAASTLSRLGLNGIGVVLTPTLGTEQSATHPADLQRKIT